MQDYDPNDMSKFSHLTNNCLVKKFQESPQQKKKREQSIDAHDASDDDEEEPENIWSLDDFKEYLQGKYGNDYQDQDIYQEIIYS